MIKTGNIFLYVLIAIALGGLFLVTITPALGAKDGNFKIKVHVGEFPANSQVCAGTDNGDQDCQSKGGASVLTFVFYNVPEGTGIWACVDNNCDYGTNTSCKCPENLYPRFTQVSQPGNIDIEQEARQEATCAIEGNNNECNINQGSSIGQDLKDFVGDIFD